MEQGVGHRIDDLRHNIASTCHPWLFTCTVTVAVFCSTVLCLIERNWWLASGTDKTQQLEDEASNIFRLFALL